MNLDDSSLIGRFLQGESDAFEALVKRYQRPIYTFLLRMSGSPETAEDLFQETFIKVLKGLPTYREQGKFDSWLFGIANRVATDAWRRGYRQREWIVQDQGAVDAAEDPLIGSDEKLERAELREAIEAALAALPEKQRRVFLLRQHGALRFREIAELTREPLNTVISHMRYAAAKLRSALKHVVDPDADCRKDPK